MRTTLRCLFALAALVCLSLAAFAAQAQALPSVTYGPNGGTLLSGSLSDVGAGYRTIASNTGVIGETLLADKVRAAIGSANADVYATRAISLRGALALGAKALPYVGAAATAYQIYTAMGCTFAGGSLVCDQGVPNPDACAGKYVGLGSQSCYAEVSLANLTTECTRLGAGIAAGAPIGIIGADWGVSQCGNWVNDSFVLSTTTVRIERASSSSGCVVLMSGKCAGGTSVAMTPDQAADAALPYTDPAKGPAMVREALAKGIDATPYAEPRTAQGPASLTGPSTQTVATPAATAANPNPTPTTVTQQTVYNITYAGDSYSYTTTVVQTNPDGSTETTTKDPDPNACGASGQPSCNVKVDETGTPTWKDPASTAIEDLKSAEAAKRDAAAQSVATPDLGWFGAPPLAECTAFEFPNNMGSLDPCGTVGTVREVMAYLWALAGAWLCFGMIRSTVTGGA